MLVAVGERKLDRSLLPIHVVERAREWRGDPLESMLDSQAFSGKARDRLVRILGTTPDMLVNLLPVDRVPGTWDHIDAGVYAYSLAFWASHGGHKLLLLGRRVGAALYLDKVPFGTAHSIYGAKCLVLPHPSRRNRWMNPPGNRDQVARWVGAFLDG